MPRTIQELELLVRKYEESGPAKLYYAMRRKSWETAELLNSVDMSKIDLEDKDNKKFDRILKVLSDSTDVAGACKILEGLAGITGNEDMDIRRAKPVSPQLVAKGEFE